MELLLVILNNHSVTDALMPLSGFEFLGNMSMRGEAAKRLPESCHQVPSEDAEEQGKTEK